MKNAYSIPRWVRPIQVGAALTDQRITEITDNLGENISAKNVNYCELTALYWMWKNKLCTEESDKYFGLFHYRRFLDITDDGLIKMKEENVDVLLPYPLVHEPDISEHHSRYIKESDWDAMLSALKDYSQKGYFKRLLRMAVSHTEKNGRIKHAEGMGEGGPVHRVFGRKSADLVFYVSCR